MAWDMLDWIKLVKGRNQLKVDIAVVIVCVNVGNFMSSEVASILLRRLLHCVPIHFQFTTLL